MNRRTICRILAIMPMAPAMVPRSLLLRADELIQ